MELKDYVMIRYNTIFFYLKHVQNRMDERDVLAFFEETGLVIDEVVAMDLNTTRKRDMIKFNKTKDFQKYVLKTPNVHSPT